METDIKHLHKDIEEIKKSISLITSILAENYELSDDAKKQLLTARETPISDYIDHAEVKKRLLK